MSTKFYDLPTGTSCIGEVELALETAGVGPGVAVLEPVLYRMKKHWIGCSYIVNKSHEWAM